MPEKKTGSAAHPPPTKNFAPALRLLIAEYGNQKSAIKSTIRMPYIAAAETRQVPARALATRAIARKAAITTELTIQVAPNSNESWVTALVSSNKNPEPRKKKCRCGRLVFQAMQLAFRSTIHTISQRECGRDQNRSGDRAISQV